MPSSGLTEDNKLAARISLVQLGETLGMSIATVNRTLQQLRVSQMVDFQRGEIEVKDWKRLTEVSQFDPAYLHLKKPPP